LYVYCNIEARSRNHCCRGKVTSIKYMSVCLNYLFSYPACKSRVLCAVLLSVACPAVSHFSTLSHERYDFRGGGGGVCRKNFFVFFLLWTVFIFVSTSNMEGGLVGGGGGELLNVKCLFVLIFSTAPL